LPLRSAVTKAQSVATTASAEHSAGCVSPEVVGTLGSDDLTGVDDVLVLSDDAPDVEL
jgi:hypothetical protein